MVLIASGRILNVFLLLGDESYDNFASPAEVGRVYLIILIVAFFSAVFIGPSECILIGIYMSGTIVDL